MKEFKDLRSGDTIYELYIYPTYLSGTPQYGHLRKIESKIRQYKNVTRIYTLDISVGKNETSFKCWSYMYFSDPQAVADYIGEQK